MKFAEREMRVPIEYPLAGRDIRPRSRNAGAADAAPKQDPHLHLVATGEPDAL